ncbi:unnamed protein product [Paramecium sonneborni]|uniref:Uncharacterized protein n=1 Tax=Paramecium sonneborni TaxID=65129 RepID=A0A8S1NT23_9CILI|nr:unnamed protein product [Paramecium sonneborni]
MKIKLSNFQNKYFASQLNPMKYLKFHQRLEKSLELSQYKIVTQPQNQLALNLQDIEELIEENRQLHVSYQKCKESLQTLNYEFEKIVNDPLIQSESDKIKYQTKKLKKVKEENKRLRQLLKSYLDNNDNRRMETHAKVELLKDELNSLVKEFAQQEQQKKQNDILISN